MAKANFYKIPIELDHELDDVGVRIHVRAEDNGTDEAYSIVGPYNEPPLYKEMWGFAEEIPARKLDPDMAKMIGPKLKILRHVKRADREKFDTEREKKRKVSRAVVVSRLTNDEIDALEATDKKTFRRMTALDNLTTGDKGLRNWLKAGGLPPARIKEVLAP